MLLVNKITKGKMKAIEKITVSICIIASISIASLEVVSLIDSKTESFINLYSGYVYLMDGSTEKANQYFDKELAKNKNADLALYGKSKIYALQGNCNESKKMLEYTLLKTKDEELKKVIKCELKELENSEAKTINEIEVQVFDSLNEVIESLRTNNKRKIDEIDKYVSIEQKLNYDEDTHEIEKTLEVMLEKDKKNVRVKKLLAKTYLQNDRYKEAYEEMKQVVAKKKDLSNITLLSDIIIECYYNNIDLLGEEDKEIQKYNKKLLKLDEDIRKINEKNSLSTVIKKNDYDKKIKKLENSKAKIEKEKKSVIIERTINYLNALVNIHEKDAIIKKLQIAKLYYINGDNEKSKDLINKAVNKIRKLKYSNDYIGKVFSEYNENSLEDRDQKNETKIRNSVKKVIDVVNSDLSDVMKNNSTNKAWSDFLTAYAKYSNIPIVITNIDTQQYPHVTVYSNLGGEKQEWLYFNKTFKKSDFELEDTNQKITDFTVEKVKNSKTNICITIDKSSSMRGMALREAKNASIEFIRNIGRDDSVGLITFSDNIDVLSDLSKDKERLEGKINSIREGGDTSIYDGGIEAIRKIKDQEGKKIVILLTDGADNSSHSSPEELIEIANQHGVIIYTIGLGEIQYNVLNNMASRTGGEFYNAPSSVELSMIYEEIQNKINNIYKFSYSIEENTNENDRYSKIMLSKDEGFDTKPYAIEQADGEEVSNSQAGNDEKTIEEASKYEFIPEDSIDKKLIFESLKYSHIIKAADNKAYSVIINGKGFNESKFKIKVGKYNIDNDKFEIVSGNKIKVYLPQDIKIGHYTIYGENELGEKTFLKDALTITRPNRTTEICLGDMTIKADSMTVTENGYSVFGNIVINDFIYINRPIDIDTKAEHNTEHRYYSGKVGGNGKIYIKFNPYSDNFVVKHFKIHEQILDSNEFEIEVQNNGSTMYNKNDTDKG
jgi:VWFA-related protein